MLKVADEAVVHHISTSILMAIKTTYSTTPIDIQVGCSVEFYNSFTHGWTNYTPQCHHSNYNSYHKDEEDEEDVVYNHQDTTRPTPATQKRTAPAHAIHPAKQLARKRPKARPTATAKASKFTVATSQKHLDKWVRK